MNLWTLSPSKESEGVVLVAWVGHGGCALSEESTIRHVKLALEALGVHFLSSGDPAVGPGVSLDGGSHERRNDT